MQHVVDSIFSISRAYIEFCSDNFEELGRYIVARDSYSVSQAATAIKINANMTGLLELSMLAARLEDYCVMSDWSGVIETYKAMQSTVDELARTTPMTIPVHHTPSAPSRAVNVKLAK